MSGILVQYTVLVHVLYLVPYNGALTLFKTFIGGHGRSLLEKNSWKSHRVSKCRRRHAKLFSQAEAASPLYSYCTTVYFYVALPFFSSSFRLDSRVQRRRSRGGLLWPRAGSSVSFCPLHVRSFVSRRGPLLLLYSTTTYIQYTMAMATACCPFFLSGRSCVAAWYWRRRRRWWAVTPSFLPTIDRSFVLRP